MHLSSPEHLFQRPCSATQCVLGGLSAVLGANECVRVSSSQHQHVPSADHHVPLHTAPLPTPACTLAQESRPVDHMPVAAAGRMRECGRSTVQCRRSCMCAPAWQARHALAYMHAGSLAWQPGRDHAHRARHLSTQQQTGLPIVYGLIVKLACLVLGKLQMSIPAAILLAKHMCMACELMK